ncbi:MAG: fatty acid desaturase [Pseudomonadota bacterium]
MMTEIDAGAAAARRPTRAVFADWPTLALFAGVYGVWIGALFAPVALAVPVLALCVALQASLQHEAIHGHPWRSDLANGLIAWPPLTLAIPYLRFHDTHLAHHRDARLTDPFEDPESNYLDPGQWAALPGWVRAALEVNNTLMGRMVLGPLIGQLRFMADDARQIAQGDARVALGWALHIPAVVAVLAVIVISPLPLWAYLIAAYGGLSILKIRTYAEHRAHARSGARSVIIEDRGPLAFLFLNNNLHVVHHAAPSVPWYQLPAHFAAHRAHFLSMNGGYHFASYREVFARYLTRAKDPVAHPLWRR